MSRINLLDEPQLLTKKIKSAKTDTFEGLEWDDPNRPEARNLINMYSLATGASKVPCYTPLRPACLLRLIYHAKWSWSFKSPQHLWVVHSGR